MNLNNYPVTDAIGLSPAVQAFRRFCSCWWLSCCVNTIVGHAYADELRLAGLISPKAIRSHQYTFSLSCIRITSIPVREIHFIHI